MRETEGVFLRHEPCERCGSSDGKAIYSNGTAYCFVCESYYRAVDSDKEYQGRKRVRMTGLLDVTDIRALHKRGITEETCRKYGYGYGKYKDQAVQIATYHHKGAPVAQHIRTADKDFSWVGEAKHLELFGQHLWRNGGKRLVVTEGELDALSVAQAFNLRWPVVSVPNGAQSAKRYVKQNLEYLESFDEIVLGFDNDEDGRKAAQECAQLLTPGKVKIANWQPHKDANEVLRARKSASIADMVFSAKQYRPDGIVAGSELTVDFLRATAGVLSYPTPYPILNGRLRGIRKAEITTLTAGSGIGKSTLAREIAYHLLTKHSLRVGYVALEESIKKSALGFMALYLNVPMGNLFLNKSLVEPEIFEEAYSHVIANDRLFLYDHFGSLDSENLISKMKFLAAGLNVDFIVLDHISIVVSGIDTGDERRIIDNLMTSLRSLVENTGVGMILISHLRVPDGTPHEEGGRVTLNQLRGSGSIKQLSDNIIGMERNQQGENPDESQLRLLKNRLFGETGLADVVEYNRETGRLLPTEDEADSEFPSQEQEDEDDVPF